MAFAFVPMEIPDVIRITTTAFPDDRGFFAELYKQSEFARRGIDSVFVQDNYSHSVRGVLRGLHYQKHPAAQGKLVRALLGEIFDVAVDIRRGSPTYGRWVAATLSGGNGQMLYIPAGFAHGFCVLSTEADVVYKATAEYAPELDRGIRWDDPILGIQWPVQNPRLSDKDAALPALAAADNNFTYGVNA